MTIIWTVSTVLAYLLSLVLIRWVLIIKKRQPASTVAWIMVIVLLPYIGGLLFLIFGVNRVQRRAARKHQARQAISRRFPELSSYQIAPGEVPDTRQASLIRVATEVAGTVPTYGNSIELLSDTNRTFGLIQQGVLAAKESLHLEYYIYRPDRAGTRLRDLLIEKAREGVRIRFLYDNIGSIWLNKRFLRPMREVGIEVAAFLPGQTLRERWSINLRNHRKIVIVDGQVGFTGGMNIGDEYLGKDRTLGFWRDTHLRMQGPAVLQLQQTFAEDWFYATGAELTHSELFPQPRGAGQIAAQVVASEPAGEVESMHALLFAAINEARRSVTLAASYFVPPPALVTALETASYRGVRVRILVAGRASFRWTILAGRSYYDSLLDAGVEIYEYERGLLHSKTLTIDGHWSLVGTANFDTRSLFLNFEVALAIYDARLAEQLEQDFERDLEFSRPIERERWLKRSNNQIFVENICRLFAPVL